MKVFEIEMTVDGQLASDYVAANTNIQALQVYTSFTGIDLSEFHSTDEIIELAEQLWDKYSVINTDYDPTNPFDWKIRTIEEIMKSVVVPSVICVNMFPNTDDIEEP